MSTRKINKHYSNSFVQKESFLTSLHCRLSSGIYINENIDQFLYYKC